jgi:ankyrin repeat protein
MEDTGLKIPHILEQIYDLIDNESLIKCKRTSRKMCSIVENLKCGKFLTTRRIQCYFKNPMEFGRDWRIVFQKLPAERLSKFEILVKDFYVAFPSRSEENWSPLHIAAERGHLDFCKFIAKVSVTKSFEWSPLLFSAQAGHLEVSKYLYTAIDDKNPITRPSQITAQHMAAKQGHLEIYQFLHESTNDINPIMQENITPLHLAAQYGHFLA